MFGQNFEEFKSAAKKTFIQMNLDDDEAEEAKNNVSPHQESSGNYKDDGYIHVKATDTPDIEAATAASENHHILSSKSRIEEELERVRRAGEEEMKAYTNQKANTRRPSLNAAALSLDQSAALADSHPKPQAVTFNDTASHAETQGRLPRPKVTSMKTSREREVFFDADNKQRVAIERAKEVTKEGIVMYHIDFVRYL